MAESNAAASKPAEKAAKGKTVKVTIARTPMHIRGTSYGPGKDIEVPAHIGERIKAQQDAKLDRAKRLASRNKPARKRSS